MNYLDQINAMFKMPGASVRKYNEILEAMINFNDHFANPSQSVGTDTIDEMRPIFSALMEEMPVDLELQTARMIKILFRKQSNRAGIGKFGLTAIVKSLIRQSEKRTIAASEIGNAVLNICYNGENVNMLIETGGVMPLMDLLRTRDPGILASTLGAVQGICYVPIGRQAVRQDIEGMQIIALSLSNANDLVRARACGCIHNFSVDTTTLSMLREINCIPSLISLLREFSLEVCQAAAGALQNISRETASRSCIMENEHAIPYLTDLLVSSDIKCQVSAIGALLNILGPSLSQEKLLELKEMLTNGLVLGAVRSSMFDA